MTERARRSPEARSVVVRRATSADLPRLGRLGALLVEVHHAFDAERFLPTRDRMPADYAAFLLRQMERPSVAVLVADDGGDGGLPCTAPLLRELAADDRPVTATVLPPR